MKLKLASSKATKNNPTPKRQCEGECKRSLPLAKFYNTNSAFSADGKLNICKDCLEKMIDYNNIETIYKILQLMDLPFYYDYWEISKDKTPDNPWGTYIRMANSKLNEFKNANWKNSIFENKHEEKNINTTKQHENISEYDLDYLMEKWGYGYKQDEYRFFEKKYNFLKNNYAEKTNMHTEALLNYIRYRVKEEIATASGQIKDAKEWATMAKDAATAAKINPSQLSKADLTEGLSTFGELTRAVEQSVDIIPILPKFKERPQDKPDFTIWCYINYVRDMKGLPPCEYKEIYNFYELRKKEYEERENKEDNIFDVDIENGEE